MSTYLGTTLLAGVATDTISNGHSLLDFKWTDHILNEMSWLRADTFSWQSGAVYVAAYNHLVADASGTAQTETIGSYTITYYRANDGHKIVLADQEQTVTNIYNESGVAWYYILDTTNTRFKLPRTKFGFTGLRDGVGTFVSAGLPNLVGELNNGCLDRVAATGAFYRNGKDSGGGYTGSAYTDTGVAFDASRSNSIYGNSTTVQPPATQMYLYFYVGEFSQSATEQTAGLNSTLFNGKVDLNAANLSIAGKSLIAGLGMPSDSYTDLTIGASGTNYTAPYNGYFCIGGYSDTLGGYFQITTSNRIDFTFQGWGQQNWGRGFIPVKKGTLILLSYSAFTFEYFKFIPAEGDV